MFPGDASGDGQTRAAMKKIFRYLVLLASLSLHAAAWGDMADNGVECSVVMEKTEFDARAAFPDFKLVFTNKGEKTVRLFDEVYSTFGLSYTIELSTMPEDHMGDEKDWKFAEDTLQAAITEMGKDFVINAGDGAFYGPKLDFHLADSLGRTWQCGEDGEKHRPVMIHRALLGSIERFIGVITEHFAGAFPAWLSPVQVKLLPVTDRAMDYAKNVAAQLDSQGFRVEVDGRNEKIGKKIREATLEKIPFMLVVGDRDMEAGTVSVRTRTGEDLGAMSLADFAAKLHEIVDSKARQ